MVDTNLERKSIREWLRREMKLNSRRCLQMTLGTRRVGWWFGALGFVFAGYEFRYTSSEAVRKAARDFEYGIEKYKHLQDKLVDDNTRVSTSKKERREILDYVSELGKFDRLPWATKMMLFQKHAKDFNVVLSNPFVAENIMWKPDIWKDFTRSARQCVEYQSEDLVSVRAIPFRIIKHDISLWIKSWFEKEEYIDDESPEAEEYGTKSKWYQLRSNCVDESRESWLEGTWRERINADYKVYPLHSKTMKILKIHEKHNAKSNSNRHGYDVANEVLQMIVEHPYKMFTKREGRQPLSSNMEL